MTKGNQLAMPRNPDRFADLGVPLPNVAPPFLRRLVAASAAAAGTTHAVMTSASRAGWMVGARHCGMWIAYHATARSLGDIGRAFRRDHSTVLHGVRTIEQRIGEGGREQTVALIADIVRRLGRPVAVVVSALRPEPIVAGPAPEPCAVEPQLLDAARRLKAEAGSRAWFLANDGAFRAAFVAAHPELAGAIKQPSMFDIPPTAGKRDEVPA